MTPIKMIIGLGNPGSKYTLTRHNIGFRVLEAISRKYNCSSVQNKFKGEYCTFTYNGRKVILLAPQTYMNLSGESVQAFMSFFKINLNEILVIHDELDIDFGRLLLKKGGGLAGHNGLKSIKQHSGSADFYRLRFGIGRPVVHSVSDWVLSPFQREEEEDLPELIDRCSNAVEISLELGVEKAMQDFNKKNQ